MLPCLGSRAKVSFYCVWNILVLLSNGNQNFQTCFLFSKCKSHSKKFLSEHNLGSDKVNKEKKKQNFKWQCLRGETGNQYVNGKLPWNTRHCQYIGQVITKEKILAVIITMLREKGSIRNLLSSFLVFFSRLNF